MKLLSISKNFIMKKSLKFTIFILLSVVLFFASCKKGNEMPLTVPQNTGADTGTEKVAKEIIFSDLKWHPNTRTSMLTTNFFIPPGNSVDSILGIYGGSQSIKISKDSSASLPNLYYKTVTNEVIIYHSYTGTFPVKSSFTNPVAYGLAYSIFIAETVRFSWVKVVFR